MFPVPIPSSFNVGLEVKDVAFWSRLPKGDLVVEDAMDEVVVVVLVLAMAVVVWDIIVGLVRIPVLVLVPMFAPLSVPVIVPDFLQEGLYPIGAKDSREGNRFSPVLVFGSAAVGGWVGVLM